MLAHAENDVTRVRFGCRVITAEPIAFGDRGPKQKPHRRARGRVGGIGERGGDGHHRPHAAEIGERHQQRDFGFVPAQDAHCVGLRCGRRHVDVEGGAELSEVRLGRRCQDAGEPSGITQNEAGEIGRAAESSGEQRADGCLGEQGAEAVGNAAGTRDRVEFGQPVRAKPRVERERCFADPLPQCPHLACAVLHACSSFTGGPAPRASTFTTPMPIIGRERTARNPGRLSSRRNSPP